MDRGAYSSGTSQSRIPLRSLDAEAGIAEDDIEGDAYVFKDDLDNTGSGPGRRIRAFVKLDRVSLLLVRVCLWALCNDAPS
jgi:hypothetical protein